MTNPVEAKSLSTLINLAANPPQYPRNITHEPLQPLTLYIVRVPGSQDVFLTPLKPSTRSSISADAINTSLYYFHVSTPEDDALRQSLNTQQSPVGQISPASSIQRKPLPNAPHSNESHRRPETPPKSYPDFQPRHPDTQDDSQAVRYAFRGQNIRLDTANIGGSQPVARKPLGPRPFHSRMQSSEAGTIKRKPVGGPNSGGRSRSSTVGSVEPATIQDATSPGEEPRDRSREFPSPGIADGPGDQYNASPSTPMEKLTGALHITIIRRDPTSGVQWNVGSISSTPDLSSECNRMEFQITTPGYQRFAREIPLPKIEDLDITAFMKNKENMFPPTMANSPESKAHQESPELNVFTRHLSMPRPRPKASRRRSSSDPSGILQNSMSKVTSPPPAGRPPVYVPHLNAAQVPAHQHFSFLSPWQGHCTFSTAMDGRSLKCRHILPTTAAPDAGVAPPAPVIAEIRFNLPWPNINLDALKKRDVKSSKDERARPSLADTAKTSWRSSMQKFKDRSYHHHNRDWDWHTLASPPDTRHSLDQNPHPHRHSRQQSSEISNPEYSDSDDHEFSGRPEEHAALDLSLGREKAGGGRGGQSAKLGKLILKDEGLKMMDLMVATGMGVWWNIHNKNKV